jgi:cytochrome c-type biogenesis protein CcmH/NrfG
MWAGAFWLARLARAEFHDASLGGPRTAKVLIAKSASEVMQQSAAMRQPALAQELQHLGTKASREVHDWLTAKLITYPNDCGLLLMLAENHMLLGISSAAEETLRKISTGELSVTARWVVNLFLSHCLYRQDRWHEAERICLDCVQSEVSARHKSTMIDQLICQALYCQDTRFLTAMEQWARRAIQIDPRNISLKGTLGGILVEQKRFEEALPLLTKTLQSKAPHDRAISTLYLGVINKVAGNRAEAEKQFHHALATWSTPMSWFTVRIQRELADSTIDSSAQSRGI